MSIGKKDWLDLAAELEKTEKDYDPTHLPVIRISYATVLAKPFFYPENVFARGLAILMRRKCFTRDELHQIRQLGFKVEVFQRTIDIPELD